MKPQREDEELASVGPRCNGVGKSQLHARNATRASLVSRPRLSSPVLPLRLVLGVVASSCAPRFTRRNNRLAPVARLAPRTSKHDTSRPTPANLPLRLSALRPSASLSGTALPSS